MTGRRHKDLTGQVFGVLTALELVGLHYNTAKNSFSDEEFINLCRDVVLNADKKNQQGGP